MVRCGIRLKCWNTMPTSRRIASTFFTSLVSSIPSMRIWPFWCSSSRLMQRIMVDLPEPDGPQTTTFCPCSTCRLMFRRTWNSPYHLLTSRKTMLGTSFAAWLVAMAGPISKKDSLLLDDGGDAASRVVYWDDHDGLSICICKEEAGIDRTEYHSNLRTTCYCHGSASRDRGT